MTAARGKGGCWHAPCRPPPERSGLGVVGDTLPDVPPPQGEPEVAAEAFASSAANKFNQQTRDFRQWDAVIHLDRPQRVFRHG